MKITDPTQNLPAVGRINTFTLISLSLMWAMFLDLISPWYTLVLLPSIMVAYGSELPKQPKAEAEKEKKSETITFN